MAGPVFVGAVQDTSRLVVEPEVAPTVGASGAEGFSVSTSVTLMVTLAVAVSLVSEAVTVTE